MLSSILNIMTVRDISEVSSSVASSSSSSASSASSSTASSVVSHVSNATSGLPTSGVSNTLPTYLLIGAIMILITALAIKYFYSHKAKKTT